MSTSFSLSTPHFITVQKVTKLVCAGNAIPLFKSPESAEPFEGWQPIQNKQCGQDTRQARGMGTRFSPVKEQQQKRTKQNKNRKNCRLSRLPTFSTLVSLLPSPSYKGHVSVWNTFSGECSTQLAAMLIMYLVHQQTCCWITIPSTGLRHPSPNRCHNWLRHRSKYHLTEVFLGAPD